MANFKITGAAKQKEFSMEYMFENKNDFLYDLLSVAETFKNISPH